MNIASKLRLFAANPVSLCAVAAALISSTGAWADPKPRGAKALDAQTAANMYAGRTVEWNSCKGGVYHGGKWQAQAYCDKNGPSVGLGQWSVTRKGSVCINLTWYWPQGESYGSKPQDKKVDCINHLVDANGQIWRNWTGDKDWWRVSPNEITKGNKLQRKINKVRKKIGV